MILLRKSQWSFYTTSLLYSWAPIHFSVTCPLDICFLSRLPPAADGPLAVLMRGVSSFLVVSLCSPIVSDHRGQIQIPKNLCSQLQVPELTSLETGLRLGCGATASITLNSFWWKSVVTVPLPRYIFFLTIIQNFLQDLRLSCSHGLPVERHTFPLPFTGFISKSPTTVLGVTSKKKNQPSFLSFLKVSFCDLATRHLHQHSFNLLQVHEAYSQVRPGMEFNKGRHLES